jgi:hypothetical protein
MRELDKISEELFDKIRARFDHVSVGNNKAERITDASQARFFNFDYISENGENFGNITISLIDENSLKIYFSSNITENLDTDQLKEWYSFLRNIKNFAKRNMLTFDVRDINRSNLDLKDLKQQSSTDNVYNKQDLDLTEGRLYGLGNNKRVSFGDVGKHKIIIKHRDQIDPDRHGSRGRQIEHIFIETPVGERFLLDHTNLHGARATANHLQNGGSIGDKGSHLINEMIKEMASMRHFVRSMKSRTFEDAETVGMVEAAIFRYNEVKDKLKKLQGRNAKEIIETMLEQNSIDEDSIDIDALRERFVKKIYDDRFNEALPYVYRAYKKHKEDETSESREFVSWADDIAETNWNDDLDDRNEKDLLRLMQSPIMIGVDAVDVRAVLSNIGFEDADDLFNELQKISRTQGPDVDARVTVAQWLANNGEQALSNQIMQILQQQNTNTQPVPQQPDVPQQPMGDNTMNEPVVNEEISILRWLSGLGKK